MTNPLLAEIQRLAREGYGHEDIVVVIEREPLPPLRLRSGSVIWRKASQRRTDQKVFFAHPGGVPPLARGARTAIR